MPRRGAGVRGLRLAPIGLHRCCRVACLSGINLPMHVRHLCMAALAVAALAWCPGAMGADLSVPIADTCPKAPEERYFPVGTFLSQPDDIHIDLLVRQWYSKALAVMEEPSLSCGVPKDAEAYRFLRQPPLALGQKRTAFSAVAVRVFRHGSHYRLEAVVLSGTIESQGQPHVSRRVTKDLSPEQWQSVIATLGDIRFWQMPTTPPEPPTGLDGEPWIVEAHRHGRHHIVGRWNGAGGIESAGRLLLGLAGLSE